MTTLARSAARRKRLDIVFTKIAGESPLAHGVDPCPRACASLAQQILEPFLGRALPRSRDLFKARSQPLPRNSRLFVDPRTEPQPTQLAVAPGLVQPGQPPCTARQATVGR